ncbi:MAG: hypothetical protein IH618_06380 [Ignavibacteriaceae bacterium]|nr:hypothetical protein [Ignavibacteriaceae bacterium]
MGKRIKIYNIVLLTIFLLTAYCLPLNAAIRYVSKTGSSTPPYLTWETAADSIQKCINICVFGDTIYVANGVYQEQVVMIPGLSLIGSGTDSCWIDSRQLLTMQNYKTIDMKNDCLVKGFYILSTNNTDFGYGIYTEGQSGFITLNKFSNANSGILLSSSSVKVYKNQCFNLRNGIWLSNSNSVISQNEIFTLSETIGNAIFINAFNNEIKPLIDSNYIETKSEGIRKSIGSRPVIKNNTIILIALSARGIFLSTSDSAKVYNNLIYAKERSANYGIRNNGTTYLQLYNNYVSGYFDSIQNYVITIGPYNTVKNNVVTKALSGVETVSTQGLVFQYNDVWKNGRNYSGFTPDTTNLSVDPMVVNDDSTQGKLDFHLQKYSPLIDAGDPTILDRDGSRSDIGLYGGPYGWTYTYEDLAPRPPHNVTATIEEGLVKLTWNKNTEADFSHYRIYRDTVTILIYDSTKMIAETPDTFNYDQLPPVNHETRFYYVITAFDNQGNQSYPSEEINVLVTGLGEHPPKGYDGYRLLANYPNPFNPSTKIPYRLKEAGYVKLYVYDLKGELVKVLVNGWQEKGFYEVVFHPTLEERGRVTQMEVPMGKRYNQMSSGIYLYMIQVYDERNIPVFSDAEKMILLK